MTEQSDVIERSLVAPIDEIDEFRILGLLRSDPNIDATVQRLARSGLLERLFMRFDRNGYGNGDLLAQVLGGKVSAATKGTVDAVAVKYPGLNKTFSICFQLHRQLKKNRAVAPGLMIPARVLSDTAANAPFSGSGATGVDPKTLNVKALDALLAPLSAAKREQLKNPLGDLRSYLRSLKREERLAQARTILAARIHTVYPWSYSGPLPARAVIFQAAGRTFDLEPGLVAAFVLAEQRDQSQVEDAFDYQAARWINYDSSIGLGQVNISTARRNNLFADLVPSSVWLIKADYEHLLTSDEFNIFAVARNIRQVANQAVGLTKEKLPNTAKRFPNIRFSAFAGNSREWGEDNIKALGAEYTSAPWDDLLRKDGSLVGEYWGEFVLEAYRDMQAQLAD